MRFLLILRTKKFAEMSLSRDFANRDDTDSAMTYAFGMENKGILGQMWTPEWKELRKYVRNKRVINRRCYIF